MYMSFKDLDVEQKRDLDYKEHVAIEAIGKALSYCKHRAAIAYSGGKDSGVLWDIIRRNFQNDLPRIHTIYGNTGVEYPECLTFARRIGKEWGGDRFHEATPLYTEAEGFKYQAQQEIMQHLIQNGRIAEILKEDGKLKSTDAMERACTDDMRKSFAARNLIWREGRRKDYWWCVDQYGWPLLGKAFSKLKARRINIDCFLRYSESKSEKQELLAYYDVLRQVKISQACCDFLKKEPSERLQAELDVDVIFKGLMASESRQRKINFTSRGYIFESSRDHLHGDPFFHCNPISIWTDEDIWAYTHKYNVPYAPLYDMGWMDEAGEYHNIKRNGCMGCGTDLLYQHNHMAMLRRTHPKQWKAFMGKGMAAEIQKLQLMKRNGQMGLLDYLPAEYLVENKPCAFDRIDRLVLTDELWAEPEPDYDAEAV